MVASIHTVAFPRHRRSRHRGAGPGGERAARLRRRGPAGQGGRGVAGAGSRRADLDRALAAAQAHHRQPLARRRRQGGQSFRPADRAGRSAHDGSAAVGCGRFVRRSRRARPRRFDTAGGGGAAGGNGGGGLRPGHRLSRGLGRRGGIRRRSRRSRASRADPPDQPLPGRPGAHPRRSRGFRRTPRRSPICATSRGRRPPSAHSRSPRRAGTTC